MRTPITWRSPSGSAAARSRSRPSPAACGSASKSWRRQSPRQTPGVSAASRVAFKDDPGSPDPALALVDGNAQILDATCAKLYNYPDTSGTAASRIIPEIALGRPTVSEHGLRYTTTVQRGFRFSPPSNAHVTAQTFRDVIERVFSPRWRAPTIEAVDAPDIVGLGAYQQRHVPTSRDSGRPAIV
jgi:ABC-type oligopeptide transport system substrate-binding subunit